MNKNITLEQLINFSIASDLFDVLLIDKNGDCIDGLPLSDVYENKLWYDCIVDCIDFSDNTIYVSL